MTEELVRAAHSALGLDRSLPPKVTVKYSGRFKTGNANVRWSPKEICFGFSRSWSDVHPEILKGLIQELLLKVFKMRGRKTSNISLYHNYIQNLHLAAPIQEAGGIDPDLLASFERVNARYFDGGMERPRLQFGQASRRTLGHYHYASDTVTLSTLLVSDSELLDYVMYHELLHKHLKYDRCDSNSMHHTPEFRRLERQFANYKDVERRLKYLR